MKFDVKKTIFLAGIFFRKNLSAEKKSSIIKKIEKILRKGDFVNGKIIGGRIERTKRKRKR